LLPPHTPEEAADLEASVLAVGIQDPLHTDQWGGVIDGGHRLALAKSLNIPAVPCIVHPGLSVEQKRALALELDGARRPSPPDAIAQRRAQRRARVAEARKDGQSLRAIAGTEGVSLAQVRRDLGEAQVCPPGTPDATPARITGRDGKCYPSRPGSGKK